MEPNPSALWEDDVSVEESDPPQPQINKLYERIKKHRILVINSSWVPRTLRIERGVHNCQNITFSPRNVHGTQGEVVTKIGRLPVASFSSNVSEPSDAIE